MLKLGQAADVTSESNPLDPAAIEICAAADPAAPQLDANRNNCPNANTGQDLLCRLFSIIPLAVNTNDLATSTTLLDASVFDMAGTEAGNGNSIVTVVDNGCKTDQCRHADGSTTALTFAYDHGGVADQLVPPQTNFAITATCDCDESKGETANAGADAADPFECVCDSTQERFQCILVETYEKYTSKSTSSN